MGAAAAIVGNAQPLHAVADLPQVEPQQRSCGRAVELGAVQGAQQEGTFVSVDESGQIAGQRNLVGAWRLGLADHSCPRAHPEGSPLRSRRRVCTIALR